jgi:hypothetical protein
MRVNEKIIARFEELLAKWFEINSVQRIHSGNRAVLEVSSEYGFEPTRPANLDDFYEWWVNSIHLLEKVFGRNSLHYSMFDDLCKSVVLSDDDETSFLNSHAVLKAAKNDYEKGYLFDIRTLIEAEVFDDFLEQAEYLLNQGCFIASAVITGSVLEDGLRKLCAKNGITISAKPKLDTMNTDLAKAGVYNLLKQKQITALADLRNKAAHGLGGFTKEDVEAMIKDVRRFMEDYFS